MKKSILTPRAASKRGLNFFITQLNMNYVLKIYALCALYVRIHVPKKKTVFLSIFLFLLILKLHQFLNSKIPFK